VNSQVRILFIAIVVFIGGCGTSNTNGDQSINESEIQVSDANPNGDSELALLMRQLFVDGETIKKKIQMDEGTITEDYIELIEKCHTAIPTDPDVKTSQFTSFNTILLNEARFLLDNPDDNKENFNQVVNKCMQCHEVFCPGPMKRIKKLYIY